MSSRLPEPIVLTLAPETTPADVLAALRGPFVVEADTPEIVDRTLLDTFDGRLHAARLLLERSKSSGGRAAVLTLREPGRRDVVCTTTTGQDRLRSSDLEEGGVRHRIGRIVGVRALLPLARVQASIQVARVCNRDGKTVARLTFESASVRRQGMAPATLSKRLYINPVLGYERSFTRVGALLERVPGLAVSAQSLFDEAVIAAGGVPGGVSSRIDVELSPTMRADTATIVICRRLATVVEDNLPGTLADIDTEFLHDLRVAIRRTRSVLKQMKGVLPPEEVARSQATLRWVQQVTSITRDLDVQLLEWPALAAGHGEGVAADLEPAHTVIVARRDEAARVMRRQLRGRIFADGWRPWTELLSRDLTLEPDDDRPNAARPIGDMASARVRRVFGRMVATGNAIDEESPPEALHDLRKLGKELRYLLEVFRQCWAPNTVAPMVTALVALQDVLGRYRDDQLQAAYLRTVAAELAESSVGAAPLVALGAVIERLGADEAQARRVFGRRFAAFASPANRRRVGRVFG